MPEQFITRDFTPAKRNSSIPECISPQFDRIFSYILKFIVPSSMEMGEKRTP